MTFASLTHAPLVSPCWVVGFFAGSDDINRALVWIPGNFIGGPQEVVGTILLICVKVVLEVLGYILPIDYMLFNLCLSDLTECTINL